MPGIDGGWDHPGWHFATHLVSLLLLIAAIAAIVYLITRWHRPTMPPRLPMNDPVPGVMPPGFDPAIAAARNRYAAGEINRDQYAEIVATLGHPLPPAPAAPSAPPAPSSAPPPSE